jgi:hypothetical protein
LLYIGEQSLELFSLLLEKSFRVLELEQVLFKAGTSENTKLTS